MMMNDDMREEFSDLLAKILDRIPGDVIEDLTDDQANLIMQGLGEINPHTILVPAFRELFACHRL